MIIAPGIGHPLTAWSDQELMSGMRIAKDYTRIFQGMGHVHKIIKFIGSIKKTTIL